MPPLPTIKNIEGRIVIEFQQDEGTCSHEGIRTRALDESGPRTDDVLNLSVETNMRLEPSIVSPLDSISTAMDLMATQNVGSVVVVEKHQ
ncbi:MAG: hypothetical protein ABSD49_14985 [Candidatus Bathyarchaeia archaeon]|jgi:CBS domain-containing protein